MIVATALGTTLAFGLVRWRSRWAGAPDVLMLIPLGDHEIVAAVSALILFTQIGWQLSLSTIMIAHITFSISYVTVVVRAGSPPLNPRLSSGRPRPRRHALGTLRLVTLPAVPAILAAACSSSRSASTTS